MRSQLTSGPTEKPKVTVLRFVCSKLNAIVNRLLIAFFSGFPRHLDQSVCFFASCFGALPLQNKQLPQPNHIPCKAPETAKKDQFMPVNYNAHRRIENAAFRFSALAFKSNGIFVPVLAHWLCEKRCALANADQRSKFKVRTTPWCQTKFCRLERQVVNLQPVCQPRRPR